MKRHIGFTLVELVLVMVIAGVAIPGVIFTFNQVVRKSVNDEMMYTATMLAEGELERVMQKSFINVVDENRDNPVSFGGNFNGYKYQVRIDPVPSNLASDPSMQNYKQIESRVTNGIIGDISLTTVVTNI